MRTFLIDYLDFYRLEAGARLTAYKKMRPLLEQHEGAEVLRLRLDEAIERDGELFALEQSWRQRKKYKVQHSERAVSLDRQLDALLGGLEDTLRGLARLKSVDLERGQLAEDMLAHLFPAGIGAITQGSFQDQAHATERLLEAIAKERRYQSIFVELRLDETLARIGELNGEYFDEVQSSKPLRLEEIEEQRELGHRRLGSIAARIFGLFPEETEEHQKARAALLAPLERQNEKLGAIYRDRARGRRDGEEEAATSEAA